jgi:hypothetical protein
VENSEATPQGSKQRQPVLLKFDPSDLKLMFPPGQLLFLRRQ